MSDINLNIASAALSDPFSPIILVAFKTDKMSKMSKKYIDIKYFNACIVITNKNICHSGFNSKHDAARAVDPDGERRSMNGMALCLANRGSESISDSLSTSLTERQSTFLESYLVTQLPARQYHHLAIKNI